MRSPWTEHARGISSNSRRSSRMQVQIGGRLMVSSSPHQSAATSVTMRGHLGLEHACNAKINRIKSAGSSSAFAFQLKKAPAMAQPDSSFALKRERFIRQGSHRSRLSRHRNASTKGHQFGPCHPPHRGPRITRPLLCLQRQGSKGSTVPQFSGSKRVKQFI